MERNSNGEGSEVYNDMKIHKKFLYQTKPIFPEAFNSRGSHFREASGKVVLLKYFTICFLHVAVTEHCESTTPIA